MNSRKIRIPEIIDILRHNDVSSQEELARMLAVRGYIVTQATLSRDLKMLKANKVSDNRGGYRYAVGDGQIEQRKSGRTEVGATIHTSVLSVERAGNLCVIKTRNGYASGLAYDIDVVNSPLVLGTIPGADTVFVAIAEGVGGDEFCSFLKGFVPTAVLEQSRTLKG